MPDTCPNCDMPLDGADYTMPWEDGDNQCGYWICRHCGAKVEDWSTDDD